RTAANFYRWKLSSNCSCLSSGHDYNSCALLVPLWMGFSPEGSWRSKASQRLKPVETTIRFGMAEKPCPERTTYPQKSCETQKSRLIAFGKMRVKSLRLCTMVP